MPIQARPGWGLLPCWQCCCTFRTVQLLGPVPRIWDKTATSKSGNGDGVWYVRGKLRCVPRFTKLKHRHRNDRRWRCERNSLSRDRSDSVSDNDTGDWAWLLTVTVSRWTARRYFHCLRWTIARITDKIDPAYLSINISDQKSPRILLNNHPNEKLFTRNHQPSTLSSWSHWPRGPVDLKNHWPPQKPTGPQFFSNDVSPSKTVVNIKTLK